MQRIIFLALGLFVLVQTGYAQEDSEKIIDREFSNQVQQIFGELERERIPHGLLEDYAFPFTDIKAYNGSINAATPTPNSVEILSEIHKTLQSARYSPNSE